MAKKAGGHWSGPDQTDPLFQLASILMSQVAASRLSEAVEAAQDLMYEAWDEQNPIQRVRLARKALKTSADCADAYVLLAMEAAVSEAEALDLYAGGVAAGERSLGEAAFLEDVGEFWGLIETRPYLRARHGLALALWAAERRDEAIDHAVDMLRLNPNDNQGVRYMLISWLLTVGRDEAAQALLRQYRRDDSAFWAWSRARLAFRKGGDRAPARKALAAAVANNRHAPSSLLRRRKGPSEAPDYYSHGDRREAETYTIDGLAAWSATPGGLEWLKRQTTGA